MGDRSTTLCDWYCARYVLSWRSTAIARRPPNPVQWVRSLPCGEYSQTSFEPSATQMLPLLLTARRARWARAFWMAQEARIDPAVLNFTNRPEAVSTV